MESSAYHLAVRAVVNREDPADLLGMGCPDDEYDPELRDLIKWRTRPARQGWRTPRVWRAVAAISVGGSCS